MGLEKIGLQAVLEDKDFQSGLTKYLGGVDKMVGASKNAASQITTGFANLGGAVLKTGAMVAGLTFAAATAAAIGLGKASWDAANKIDGAMDTIAITTGASGKELESLGSVFSKVFGKIPTDADTAAQVIGQFNARLGLTGDDLSTVSVKLLEMSRLLGGDAVQNTELFSRVMGDWGIANADASLTLDKLFKASQETGAGVEGLMANVVQFGAPLRLMGFSIEESIALFAKWEKEGVNAELVMGSLRIAAGNFADAGIPLRQGLQETMASIAGMKDESAALALGMEVFGARAGPDMVAAIREGRFSVDELVATLGTADGAILTTAAATADWGERMAVLKNKVTLALAPIGNVFMDIASAVLDWLLPALESLTPIFSKIAEVLSTVIIPAVKDLALGFQLLVTQGDVGSFMELVEQAIYGVGKALGVSKPALDAFADGFRAITKTISEFVQKQLIPFVQQHAEGLKKALLAIGAVIAAAAIATAIAGIAGAIASLVNPITLIIGAVALLAVAWTENWGGIQDKVKAAWAIIEPIFNTLAGWLSSNLPGAWDTLRSTTETVVGFVSEFITDKFGAILELVQENWPLIQETIETVLGAVKAAVESVVGGIVSFWQTNHETIERVARAVWDVFSTMVSVSLGNVLGVIKAVMQIINGDWEGAWETLKATAENALGAVSGLFERIFGEWIQIARNQVGEWIAAGQAMVQGLIDGIEGFIDNVKAVITRLMDNIPQWVKDLLGIHSPSTVFVGIGEAIPEGMAQGIVSKIATVIAALEQLFGAMGQHTTERVKAYAAMLGSIGDALGKAVAGLTSVTGMGKLPGFAKALDQFFQYLLPAFNKFNTLSQTFSPAALEKVGAFAQAVGGFVGILKGAVEGLQSVGGLTDIAAFNTRMQRLGDYLQKAATVIVQVAKQFKGPALEAANAFAVTAGAIVALLKGAVEGLQAVGDLTPVTAFHQRMKRLGEYIEAAVREIAAAATRFGKDGLEQVEAFTAAAGQVASLLAGAVAGLQAVGDLAPIDDFRQKMNKMAEYLMQAVGAIGKVGKEFGTKTLDAAKAFAEAAGAVIGILEPALAAVTALGSAESWGDVNVALGRLEEDVWNVFEAFRGLSDAFHAAAGQVAGDVLDNLSAFASTVGNVVALVKPALEAVQSLAGAESWGDVNVALGRLEEDVWNIFEAFRGLSDAFYTLAGEAGDALLEQVGKFTTALGAVMGVITPAIEGIKGLLAYQTTLNLPALAAALAHDVGIVTTAFQEIASDMNTKGMEAAGEFATAGGKVVGIIEKATKGLDLLRGYVSVITADVAKTLATDIKTVVEAFQFIASSMAAEGVAAAATFAEKVGIVFGFIKDALSVLGSLKKYSSPTSEKMQTFLADVQKVVALVSEAVDAMFAIDDPGPLAVVDLYLRGVRAVTLWLNGMIAGISQNAPAVIAAIRNLINQVVGAAETGLGIASPSDVFEDIGADTVQGLVEGILARAREAVAAMIDLIDRISGENVRDYYNAGRDSAVEWLRGWAETMRNAALAVSVPTMGAGGLTLGEGVLTQPVVSPPMGATGGGNVTNFYITAIYRDVQTEASLIDTVRLLQMGSA